MNRWQLASCFAATLIVVLGEPPLSLIVGMATLVTVMFDVGRQRR